MTKWIERYRRQAEERYRPMTTTTTHETEIILDLDVPLVRIIRVQGYQRLDEVLAGG